jgi:cytochrome P450
MTAFIDIIIQKHQDSRGAVPLAATDDDDDLLDMLLRIQREDELDPPLTTENIKAEIIVRFPALI